MTSQIIDMQGVPSFQEEHHHILHIQRSLHSHMVLQACNLIDLIVEESFVED